MDLHILWFVLIGILFTGFFVLEGFDYGVGILLPLLGKKGHERDMIIHTIAPFWDGNEVWLIAGTGAIFAAFPIWYATMFSSFYLEIFFMLFALILRGAAIEFRGQRETARWRSTWDWLIFIGSILPGFLWGMILSNMITGMPVDAHQNYAGTVLTAFNAQAILFGLAFVALFTLHGALFLNLRIELGELTQRAHKTALFCWLPVVVLFAAAYGLGYAHSELMRHIMTTTSVLPINVLLLVVMLLTLSFLLNGRTGWAFTMTTLLIILGALEIGFGAFPKVMLSSLSPDWTLTAYNSSSSPYTLTVMSWIALSIVPIILVYQAWNYYIFRQRVQLHAVIHEQTVTGNVFLTLHNKRQEREAGMKQPDKTPSSSLAYNNPRQQAQSISSQRRLEHSFLSEPHARSHHRVPGGRARSQDFRLRGSSLKKVSLLAYAQENDHKENREEGLEKIKELQITP